MDNFANLKNEYEELGSLPLDSDGPAKRRRGFAFERLLNRVFTMSDLDPRAGYRPAGEQIDGSIYFDGRVYLLEAKWHADPLPASTLYQFRGKVDGKLVGTIGIFISMSGYAEDAVDALLVGKGLNIILFDRHDMDAAILRGIGFKKVLKLKLRKAAEEGAIYFPIEGELVTAEETRTIEIEHLQFDLTGGVLSRQPDQPAAANLLIVCEGEVDRVVIATLTERILLNAASRRSVEILTAMGKLSIPRVANALRSTFRPDSKVLIVTDADADPVGTVAMLTSRLEFREWVAAIPNPSIETWLGLDLKNLRGAGKNFRIEQARQAAQQLDIEALRQRDQEFARFLDTVLGR
jgi:Restriction endonuclease